MTQKGITALAQTCHQSRHWILYSVMTATLISSRADLAALRFESKHPLEQSRKALSPLTQATLSQSCWLPIWIYLSSHNTKAHVAHLSWLSTNAHDNLDGLHFVNLNGKGDKNGKFHSSAVK